MKKISFFLALMLAFFFSGCSTDRLPLVGKKVKKEYFTGGKVRSEFIMDDNSGQNGILKKYGYDGKVTSVSHMKNGVNDGDEIWYDKHGRILMKIPYANGKKHGVQETYYSNGDLFRTITYQNGVKEGKATIYQKNGKIYKQAIFSNNRIVS